MKSIRLNKVSIYAVLLIAIALLLTAIAIPFVKATVDEVALKKAISGQRLSDSDLKFHSSMQNNLDETLYIYTDETYMYTVNSKSNTINNVCLNPEALASWERKGKGVVQIDSNRAQQGAIGYLSTIYPEYNGNNIIVTDIKEYDTPYDHFIIEVTEKKGSAIINEAYIGIAVDGTLTSYWGSRNSESDFIGSDRFTEEEVREFVLKEFLAAKPKIEKSVKEADNSMAITEEKVAKVDEAILPDGITSPNDYREYKLPDYKININSRSDIEIISMARVKFHAASSGIAWRVELTYKTSWGEVDSMFNPYVIVWVDSNTGKIIDSLYAAGE